MDNKMKQYLGEAYTENHLRNFCLYWMKGREGRDNYANWDDWRRENDLDCMYFNGDMRADTLMSAWTPIKWVADFLNQEIGMKFYKNGNQELGEDYFLKLLAQERDVYLPPNHELVQLLDRFLALAEERCNFLLLPDRRMNAERYQCIVCGEKVAFFDEVPATLYHIFERESLGKYFLDESGEVDSEKVEQWVKREHLDMGYEEGHIDRNHVLPLTKSLLPGEAKMFTTEEEIREALEYMIHFLEERKQVLELEGITCQEIRDLYHILKGLKQPYLLGGRRSKKDQEKALYYLEDLGVHIWENECYYDPCGVEIPASRVEGISMKLVRIEGSKKVYRNLDVGVNVYYENEDSVEKLLADRGITIPDAEEISGVEMKDGIPVYHSAYCAESSKKWASRGDRLRSTAIQGFEDYLKNQKVFYTREENGGLPFILFRVPASNVPDEEIEGIVLFDEYVAEMKLYYIGTRELCKKSNYRDELFRVLNFVNARLFPTCNETPNDGNGMQLYFVPRICLDDSGYDIVAGTMFHYEIWNQFLWEVGDYATRLCVEFLDTLAEPFLKVLTGEINAEEAIDDIIDRIE